MQQVFWPTAGLIVLLSAPAQTTLAHDPVFGIGPHVLYKGGIETAVNVSNEKTGSNKDSELSLEAVYGITGNWAAGIEMPYGFKSQVQDEKKESSNGLSDIKLFTKYRFWRKDSLGLQESAAVMFKINGKTGDETEKPPLGNGATDVTAGLTYGYESIKWYRWASVRYGLPGKNDAGYQLGGIWKVDFVGGWRPQPPEYKKPDTVWLLELNGEISDKAELNGNPSLDSGGTQWFVSPGIFWTMRNFAIKSGIQIPIASNLNGTQDKSDYRFKASFEWHI